MSTYTSNRPLRGPNKLLRVSSLILGSLLLGACDGPTEPVPGEPVFLIEVAGDSQFGLVETELADPLVVRVLDQDSIPVPGVRLVWHISLWGSTAAGPAGARLSTSETHSDARGFASNRAVLGSEVGVYYITAGFIHDTVIFQAAAASFEDPRPLKSLRWDGAF